MILRRYMPAPPLDQFIEFFWYYEGWQGDHSMERLLPDGTLELVINLLDGPRKLFDRHDPHRHTDFRRGWLSGTHSRYIEIDTMPGASMIGAHFKPGGARPFLGPSAAEFRDRVVELDAVWDAGAWEMRERLLAAPGPAAKFQCLEQFLLGLLRRSRRVQSDPMRQERIAWVVGKLSRQTDVRTIGATAETIGVSHKHLISQFQDQVGLTPKLFCRIRRFQEVLVRMNGRRVVPWAEVACACGFYDQSHLVNEFQAFAGLNPCAYRSVREDYASFVPMDGR
jgi:AraC-like DNA-binding protein